MINVVQRGRIALGMSGGVDSSTSAAILQREGYEVVGVTCRFVDGPSTETAIADARSCCDLMGIQHVVYDARASFNKNVVAPFVDEYARGLTPIPCVHCNMMCKVPSLLDAARSCGCDSIATGHYARIAHLSDVDRYVVKTALDHSKDQSYMLSLLTQDQLSHLVLPLGGTTKLAVRVEARDIGLPVADKAESQDVCFIQGDYRDFLADHGIVEQPGSIVDEAGNVLGAHTGLSGYTIGQRKGIGVAAPEPLYVIGKCAERNELIVGFVDRTLTDRVDVVDCNWQAFKTLDAPMECSVKLRYRADPAPCLIEPTAQGARVTLKSPQPTTAPGQCGVFSIGDTILGGATISSVHRLAKGDDSE